MELMEYLVVYDVDNVFLIVLRDLEWGGQRGDGDIWGGH